MDAEPTNPYRAIAIESDQVFLARCRHLIEHFPDTVGEIAMSFLDDVERLQDVPVPESLYFLPIGHSTKNQQEEQALADEVPRILADNRGRIDLLACGECVVNFTNELEGFGARKRIHSQISELANVKLTPEELHTMASASYAFSTALLVFASENPELPVIGVDSPEGVVLMAIGAMPQMIGADANSPQFREVVGRLHIEARTRYSLGMAAQAAKGGRVLFVQGLWHGHGVVGWAKRHGVQAFEILMPDVLRDVAKKHDAATQQEN